MLFRGHGGTLENIEIRSLRSMNSMYGSFASVYDPFMEDVDYSGWKKFIVTKLRENGIRDGLVCELGCGTGTMTELLASAGYDMIGIDSSVDMLEAAQEKKIVSGHDILYLEQDMRDFELYGTVRAIVSVCDCMNYLLEEEGLLQTFRWVNNYLDPEGIFLFDMNTEEKYRRIGENTIAENRKEGSFIWQNSFDEKEKINEYDLTLFIPENDGRQRPEKYDDWEADDRIFRKTEEVHLEKAYPPETVIRLLEEAGMRFERMYDGYTDRTATKGSQRIVYLARENGKKPEKGV